MSVAPYILKFIWISNSISPANISDGTAYFTDDRGYEYRVDLN